MNLKNNKMKPINIIFFILLFNFSFGQEYEGKISTVFSNGLHEILLSPEIRSASKDNMAHFRILDSKKREVPYVFFDGKALESKTINFPIFSKNILKNKVTSIVFSNTESLNIDHLLLKIANTDVVKKYNIYGSNDTLEWFGLVNNQRASGLNDSNGTAVEHLFGFPLNNYKYLKFEFIDKNSLPINVLEANLYLDSISNREQIVLEDFVQKVTSNKKLKQTEIQITFKKAQVINEIQFFISAPNYFLRETEIIVEKSEKIKNRKESYQKIVERFELNSNKTNKFFINQLFVNQFTVIIHNADNPELVINKIELLQNQSSVIADLKKNEKYTIIIDNKLNAPNYDLARLGIDLKANYPKTSIVDFEKISKKEGVSADKGFWQSKAFMWICIVLAVLILGFFSLSMIKDLGKKN